VARDFSARLQWLSFPEAHKNGKVTWGEGLFSAKFLLLSLRSMLLLPENDLK
jgi:hypothetical protein